MVRADDADYFATFAARHSDETFPTLWKSLRPILPRQVAKRRNNIRCQGPAPADIVAHLDQLEAGTSVPYPELLAACHREQQEGLFDAPLFAPLNHLPSRLDVERLCGSVRL